ncbi:pentatricopeptide repeat-containing protein At5g55740, chloroplastic-like [Cannabis sativa]|uniref:pentatricopeptide repeat-containing protein At5g55740, chloroplastic-like n=1 Tax=Cannabis sativa TaxID=3483 RepID=UPI0029CA4B84|nr:pentatricopeptide repeat-containing protein At5g55740, chloroplastic-like [Cannabis sativa]
MLSVFLQISLPPNLFNLQTEIQEAMDLFTKMKLDNLQVQPEIYGELLQGCVYALDLSTGQQIHDRIGSSETNVFSWAAIIGMNCRMGFCDEALLGLLELLDSGHFPDNFVVPNALKACGAFQWIGMGKGIHGYAIKMGYGNGICVFVSSSLGDMYGKCGAMEDARMVFDGIPEKNVVTWNSLMVGYVLNGENEKTIKLFCNLMMESVEPT